jgi:hypothetical protein
VDGCKVAQGKKFGDYGSEDGDGGVEGLKTRMPSFMVRYAQYSNTIRFLYTNSQKHWEVLMMTDSENNKNSGLIPPHGGYRNLRSFKTAQLVYDATVIFCNRFIDRRSRTHDQMVQAARSGTQILNEGGFTERLYRERQKRRGDNG